MMFQFFTKSNCHFVFAKIMEKSCLWFLPSFFLVQLLLVCFAMAATNITTDQSSLLSLKHHISSDPYQFLANNWSIGAASVCDWIGVTCGSRPLRVIGLNLSNMGLTGTIPPHLGNLSFLVSLDLSKNSFHGNLPSDLARLRRLEVLNFIDNYFSGEIPSWFGSLHTLRMFSLEKNNLTGSIPPSIFNLSNLEELRFASNSLEGSIPGEIGNLRNLKTLATGFNYLLQGPVPIEIFNISSLEYIWSSGNRLHGSIPSYVCDNLRRLKAFDLTGSILYGPVLSILSNCSQLRWLAVAHSFIGGVMPEEIQNMKAVEVIYLGDCNLTGKIPRALGNLTRLRTLSVQNNFVTGTLPWETFNNSSLDHIDFRNNSITGSLPNHICDSLPRLKTLDLQINSLNGQIPYDLSRCSTLVNLYLNDNNFEGSIPRELGNLTMLGSLSLQDNHLSGDKKLEQKMKMDNLYSLISLLNKYTLQASTCGIVSRSYFINVMTLTGTIPRELGNLSKLEKLWLMSNNFKGPIPFDALANCKNLTEFKVANNPLRGVLPDSVGNLSSSLQVFDAFNCGITGSIPDTVGNLKGLVFLDLSWNGLSGMLPSSLKFLQNLQVLNLRRNKLRGVMIDRLCSLKSLSEVHMEYNEISGPIFECLGDITSLRHLSLSSNRLDGNIPINFRNLKDLIELNLSTNILSGPLPVEIGNLKAATWIDLSTNNISGSLPVTIGYLQKLQILCLNHNKIQGSIPKEMGEMISLVSLDLSHNSLSGMIPKSLEKLRDLMYFNVSFNYLSGEIPNGGPFSNFTNESFTFNEALCGSQMFNVPTCSNTLNKRKVPRIVIVFIVVGAFMGAVVFGFVYLRYRKKKNVENEMESVPLGTQERISYYELSQATDGYDEKNLLGTGSFGSVYKGILRDGRIVAIKVFNLQQGRASKSFNVECMVLGQLRHRNLTKVISTCSNSDFKALVLEYMINGSLEQWLYAENYFLDFMQRLDIMIDVAFALGYLHSGYSTPIVHCDLKPSNILLDENMVAHVSDFGIAKLLGHEDSITCTQTLATFGYLAPEYGMEGLVSTKCDVYSYGILLMEVFTRKKPSDDMFEGNFNLRALVHSSVLNSLALVVDANLLSVDERYSKDILECVTSIMEVALNCTRDSPKERFTMADVIAALEKIKFQIPPYKTKT